MKSTFILDACGLIAFLRNEEGAEKIKAILLNPDDQQKAIVIHYVNFCEVYYDTLRTSGKPEADQLFRIIPALGISFSSDFSEKFIEGLGFFKTNYKISLADSFALAQTAILDGILITSDHHEFDKVSSEVNIHFIR